MKTFQEAKFCKKRAYSPCIVLSVENREHTSILVFVVITRCLVRLCILLADVIWKVAYLEYTCTYASCKMNLSYLPYSPKISLFYLDTRRALIAYFWLKPSSFPNMPPQNSLLDHNGTHERCRNMSRPSFVIFTSGFSFSLGEVGAMSHPTTLRLQVQATV